MKDSTSEWFTELRRLAEQAVSGQDSGETPSKRLELAHLVHELEVYQAELEIQNSELRRSQEALARSHRDYVDLYDSAPVGYVTLDQKGLIVSANLEACRLLGVPRKRLIGAGILRFIASASRPAFLQHQKALWESEGTQTCEVWLAPADGEKKHARLEGVSVPADNEDGVLARTIIVDNSAEQRASDMLIEHDEQMRTYAARLESVREEERTSIARELHDQIGQAITALRWDVQSLRAHAAAGEPADVKRLDAMIGLIDTIGSQVRELSADLRPGMLDDFGLAAAIEWQLDEYRRRTGAECSLSVSSTEEHDTTTATVLYRVFQELLTNVLRHANARSVHVNLAQEDGSHILEVSDDGQGMTPEVASSASSLGFLGMRERLGTRGGTLTVLTAPNEGTRIRVAVPVR